MSAYSTQLNSYKTATARVGQSPSAPMKRLAEDGLLNGRMLDYGCGKGIDAAFYGMESFDPHFQPHMPSGEFDTITCNYVLNVIESPSSRCSVLRSITYKLATNGIAYVTVRNDRTKLNGVTSIGTWQGHIKLDLTVLYRCSGYVTYILYRSNDVRPIA